jgi:hypothetical protein
MKQAVAKVKAEEIYTLFFSDSDAYLVTGEEESIPLVLANMIQSSNSFTQKQLVYIYGGHWGMSERLKILGKYRAKNRLIEGHCDVNQLTHFRPKIIFNPAIIAKLKDTSISAQLFQGFSDPQGPYLFKVSENE